MAPEMGTSGEEMLTLLERVSAILGAAAELRSALRDVASALVPALGDGCALHLRDGERAKCVAHTPVGVGEPLEDVVLEGVEAVLASGSATRREGRLEAIGLATIVQVPLKVGPRPVVGVLTLVLKEADPAGGERRLQLVQEIAHRLAMLVEHTRELEQARISSSGFEAMLSEMTDGITIQAANGQLLFANDAVGRLCGFGSGRALLEAPWPERIVADLDACTTSTGPRSPSRRSRVASRCDREAGGGRGRRPAPAHRRGALGRGPRHATSAMPPAKCGRWST